MILFLKKSISVKGVHFSLIDFFETPLFKGKKRVFPKRIVEVYINADTFTFI